MPEAPTLESLQAAIRSDAADAVAAHRRTRIPVALLRELHESAGADPDTAFFLCSQPDTPSRILEDIAQRFRDEERVLTALAQHARTPSALMVELASAAPSDVRLALAGNRQLSPQAMRLLAADPDSFVRVELAQNASLSPAVREILARDAVPFVRAALARQARLEPELTALLSHDPDPLVKAFVIVHGRVEADQLLEWADSDDRLTQSLLLLRPRVTDEVRESLCFSPHTDVRDAALASRSHLAEDEILGWSRSADSTVRMAMAKRQDLQEPIQYLLATDPSAEVRRSLAANPCLCEHVARSLIRIGDTATLPVLATNPALGPVARADLIRTEDADLLALVADRQDLLEDEVLSLSRVGDERTLYHLAYAGHPGDGLPREIAAPLLRSALPTLRAFAASSCGLAPEDLVSLREDVSGDVRRAVAANPQTPVPVLRFLTTDPVSAVATTAVRQSESRLQAVAEPPQTTPDADRSPSTEGEGFLHRLARRLGR